MKKLLILGLDGATFPLLNAYAREHPDGVFNRWLSYGHVRTLRSTIPYSSVPAWTTFMTGLLPSLHGLYHSRDRYNPAIGCRPYLSSRHLTETSFWSYCQQHGGRVSVSNFPAQHPAPPTNGRYICGELPREAISDKTWPPSLSTKICEAIPGYQFGVDDALSGFAMPAERHEHILQVGRDHLRALELFGAGHPYDLLVHIMTVTGWVQHLYRCDFQVAQSNYADSSGTSIGDPVFDAYALAEEAVRKLWNQGNWDNVVILSAYGTRPWNLTIYTDVWLAHKGYTTFQNDGQVDVPASLAYSGEESEHAIYVNTTGQEGWGVKDAQYGTFVEDLRQDLLNLTIPSFDIPVFERVLTRAELHLDTTVRLGPDLVLVPSEGVRLCPSQAKSIYAESTRQYADRGSEGIFIGFGADFGQSPFTNDSPPVYIQDLFPLMSALMGLPIPGGLSGAIPADILTGLCAQPQHDPNWDWRLQVKTSPRSHTEVPQLLSRLVELGYI